MYSVKQYKKPLLSIAFTLAANLLFAQENVDAQSSFLKAVYETYNTAESYQMEVEVGIFDQEESLLFPIQKNKTIKSGNNFYIHKPELTTVITAEYNLLVDHVAEEIRYVPFTKEQQSQNIREHTNIPDFSQMKDMIESIELGMQKTKIIFKETPAYKSTIYTINTTSKLLEQVDYYATSNEFGQPEHIQILYVNSIFNGEIDSMVFQLDKYISETNEILQPSETYKTYSLIKNNIN